MGEIVIVTLTSYRERLSNLPVVLDTVFSQTIPPDLIVLNLAYEESVQDDVLAYLEQHHVEINRVPDTKVYKKLIPTLIKYPEACVISIDDDFLYPKDMISDFLAIHQKYPQFPISGNREILFGMKCHCGCASLTKAEYFGDYLYQIDDAVLCNCPADDISYTYFATKAGHPYIQTENLYFHNMPSYGNEKGEGYSDVVVGAKGNTRTYEYLVNRFGMVSFDVRRYFTDACFGEFVYQIEQKDLEEKLEKREMEVESKIHSTYAYRIGKFLLKPMSWLRNRLG